MPAALVHPWSSISASQRWTARTWRAFFAATAARSSRRSTTRCATARHYGRADDRHWSVPDIAGALVERHQVTDLPDPRAARGVRTGITRARLSLPLVAVYADIRFAPR